MPSSFRARPMPNRTSRQDLTGGAGAGDPWCCPGMDPWFEIGVPAPAVVFGLAGRHAGRGPRKRVVHSALWVVVA